jgi:hypothetical protein
MKGDNAGSSEQAELNRYRQAADVAYRYAKNKLESKAKPEDKEDESAFGPDKEEVQK